MIEGTRAVSDVLDGDNAVREVFLTDEIAAEGDLADKASRSGAHVFTVTSSVMRALSDTMTPQGAVAVADMHSVAIADLPDPLDLVLVLSGVSDPGNAGTLLRSGVAAGADAIAFTSGSVDPFAPKTVRAAAGALFDIPIVRGGTTTELLTALKERGLTAVGTDATGVDATVFDLTGPLALVVGNEAWGIDERSALDAVVAIEMPGRVESLNVAVAGSIVLFEATRQRRDRGDKPLSSDAQ